MPFGLQAWMDPGNHVLDGGPAVLRDIAMETNFGRQFAINGFVGYNIGCMIASDTLFDSRGGFWGQAIHWRYSQDRVTKGRHGRDSQTNHSSRFVPVAKQNVLFATGCRYRWKSVLETMTCDWFLVRLGWYQKLVLETGQCVMGLTCPSTDCLRVGLSARHPVTMLYMLQWPLCGVYFISSIIIIIK